MNLLLLHSSGTGPRQFKAFERLPHDRIAPDFRERWPAADPGWRIQADLDKTLALLDQTEGPVDIVGHSYGGALGLKVALARPDRVRHIVLHEPVLWGCYRALATPSEVREFDQRVAPFLDPARSGDPTWVRDFIDFWSGAGTFDALLPPMQESLVAQGHKLFAQVHQLMVEDQGPEQWTALPPFHVTLGRDTPLAQRRSMSLLADTLPQMNLELVDGGHMAPVTKAVGWFRRVQGLLEG